MTIDADVAIKIASPIIATIGIVINLFKDRKSRLISYYGHVSSFILKGEPETQVYAHSVIVQNTGNKSATNVRLSHNFCPENISIHPEVKYIVDKLESGGTDIVIPTLVPKEQVTISYLYFPPITYRQINTQTKSDEGFAKIVDAMPMPLLSAKIIRIYNSLALIGLSFVIYFILKLMILVLER